MRKSAVIVSVVAAAAVAAVPVGAQAAPTGVTQPYGHLVSGTTWSTGGAYVAKSGKIELTLKTLPKATDVLVEECDEGGDLGEVQVFTKNASSHVLATGVAKGTCFLVLFQPHAGAGGYRVGGTLKY